MEKSNSIFSLIPNMFCICFECTSIIPIFWKKSDQLFALKMYPTMAGKCLKLVASRHQQNVFLRLKGFILNRAFLEEALLRSGKA